MFLCLSVILFTRRGGGVHPQEDTLLGRHLGRYTLWADTPLSRHPPAGQTPHPTWADTPSETATAADSTHPTGMYSCFTGLCLPSHVPSREALPNRDPQDRDPPLAEPPPLDRDPLDRNPDPPGQKPPPRQRPIKSGQYASYSNAFLFTSFLQKLPYSLLPSPPTW